MRSNLNQNQKNFQYGMNFTDHTVHAASKQLLCHNFKIQYANHAVLKFSCNFPKNYRSDKNFRILSNYNDFSVDRAQMLIEIKRKLVELVERRGVRNR